MNRTGQVSIVIAVGALVLAGCGSKSGSYKPVEVAKVIQAKVEPGNESVLFPLAEGNYWVYELNIGQQVKDKSLQNTIEVTFKVTSVSDLPDGKKATIDVMGPDGKTAERQTWSITSKGIFQNTSGTKQISYNPAQPILLFPVTSKTPQKWNGTGITPLGETGTMSMDNTPEGAEEADTAMGRMSAYAMSSQGDFKGPKLKGKSFSKSWFAPKVGMVRSIVRAEAPNVLLTQVFRLKSYKVK